MATYGPIRYGGFIDSGAISGTVTYTNPTDLPTAGLRIGTRSGTSNYFNGFMEDIRITDGYARYQGNNFTPPTETLRG